MISGIQDSTANRIIAAFIAVLLIISGVFISLRFFMSRSSELAERRNALLIASSHMFSMIPESASMQDGFYADTEISGNTDYIVETSLATISDNAREISVSVFSPSGENVELIRNVYGKNETDFEKN